MQSIEDANLAAGLRSATTIHAVLRQTPIVGKKGEKSKRGVGERYPETKTVRCVILLTPTANKILLRLAIQWAEEDERPSKSQTMEQLLRDEENRGTLD